MTSSPFVTGRPYERLGAVLDRARGTVTQTSLAEQLDVAQAAVNQWMVGRSRPRPGLLGRLAALLDLDPSRLIELADYDDNPNARDKVFASFNRTSLQKAK